jgi:hypothetical protein
MRKIPHIIIKVYIILKDINMGYHYYLLINKMNKIFLIILIIN